MAIVLAVLAEPRPPPVGHIKVTNQRKVDSYCQGKRSRKDTLERTPLLKGRRITYS
jgi:hypothetical protein